MREIKFRCFHRKANKIFYMDFEGWFEIDGFSDLEIGDLVNPSNKNIAELMQYTGLKDKNGKEIYEGDVVKDINYNYGNGEIVSRNGNTEIRFFDWDEEGGEAFAIACTYAENGGLEVIGNIYENPELTQERD